MKTIAFILLCVLAMVCFRVYGAEPSGAAEPSWENHFAYRSSWYFHPAADEPARNYVEDIDKQKCTCRGIKLYGRVKVVESFPDLKVKVVESFPDIRVKAVASFADECGKWQFVESFPDFTIKYVESFPDLKIKFVESFPGM